MSRNSDRSGTKSRNQPGRRINRWYKHAYGRALKRAKLRRYG